MRILLVEDRTETHDALRTYLSLIGNDVTAVKSGEDALNEMSKWIPDILVTDHLLTGITGMGLVGVIRDCPFRGSMPAIVITALPIEDLPALCDEAKELGNTIVLSKPFDPEKLKEAINLLTKNHSVTTVC